METILKSNDRQHHRIAFDESTYTKIYDGEVMTGDYAQIIHEERVMADTYVNMYEWYVEAEALEPFNFYADFMLTYGSLDINDKIDVQDQNAVTLALIPDGTTIKEGYYTEYEQALPGGLKIRERPSKFNAVVISYDKDIVDGTLAVPADAAMLSSKGDPVEARVFYKITTDYSLIKTVGLDCMVMIGKYMKDNLVKLRIYRKALTDDGVAV